VKWSFCYEGFCELAGFSLDKSSWNGSLCYEGFCNFSFRRKSSSSGRRSKARVGIVSTLTLFAFFILLSISSSPLYLPISLFPSLHPSSSNISPHLPFRFYTSLPTSYITPPFITPPSPSAPHLPSPNRISASSPPTTTPPFHHKCKTKTQNPKPLELRHLRSPNAISITVIPSMNGIRGKKHVFVEWDKGRSADLEILSFGT